jgi:uncharacterized protein YjiS (DUF1127 family)
MQDMQNLHFTFCCTAHIFRSSKKRERAPELFRLEHRKETIMFEVLKTRISAWKRYSRTVSELNALSNRELSDLGLARADIPRVAREATR